MKKYLILMLAVFMVVLLGCFQTPTEIKVTPPKVELYEQGGTVDLKAVVFDQKGKEMKKVKLEYSSENSGIVTVDDKGKATAQMSGETKIRIASKKISKTIPVFVRIVETLKVEFPVSGIYEAQGPENSLFKLNVQAKNESGNDMDLSLIKFKSSNEKAATVDKNGNLTLLSDGKTVISAEIGKKKVTLDVPVIILRPSLIKVDSSHFVVSIGETAPLPFTVISTKGPSLVDYPVKVEFDHEGVASANEHGEVTGIARGTVKATITAGEATNSLTLQVK
jgi:hypothetical protein